MEQQPNKIFNDGPQQALPNATAVLVLGIVSILGCACYGIVGMTCGIIGLVLANKDRTRYNLSPDMYTASSYANLKAGRVCSIIGISLSALYIVFVIFIIAAIGIAGLSNPQEFLQHYK